MLAVKIRVPTSVGQWSVYNTIPTDSNQVLFIKSTRSWPYFQLIANCTEDDLQESLGKKTEFL